MPGSDQNNNLIAIDVGGGTQDVLIYIKGQSIENCPKMVMPAPTRIVAGKIAKATADRKPVFLFGEIMGGGSCTRAAREHIEAGLPLYATPQAALTFHDDLKRVREMGVILGDTPPADAVRIRLGDIDKESIESALHGFGLETPGHWAVAVQDHGHSPDTSNREARFGWYREFIDSGGQLEGLVFTAVPKFFTRMLAIKNVLPDALVMDTGPAAILGALLDDGVRKHRGEGLAIVNMGNRHVMCALVRGEKMVGLLEHHTGMLDTTTLRDLLARFRTGALSNEEVLRDGGHGCHMHKPSLRSARFDFVAVTGPNRGMLKGGDIHTAVPHGDIMLTGCFGLLEAARKLGIIQG